MQNSTQNSPAIKNVDSSPNQGLNISQKKGSRVFFENKESEERKQTETTSLKQRSGSRVMSATKIEEGPIPQNGDLHLQRQQTSSADQSLYYVTRFNEKGELEGYHKEKQFIIPINSEVWFYLDCGLDIASSPKLIVNKPIPNLKTGELVYTVTQPCENGENSDDEETFLGSELPTRHLEIYEPDSANSVFSYVFIVKFKESGSFFVQLKFHDAHDPTYSNYTPPMYINIEPKLTMMGRQLECKELSLITMMSKQLGPLSRWSQVLKNAAELGYNAIHFTPFQTYGESQSHYSIADQTEIDDYFFSDSATQVSKKEKFQQLGNLLSQMRSKGLLSIVDIVLNHTASNSKWIEDHPSATYNTDDCPHLWSAWLLDKALKDFSYKFMNKKVPECKCAPFIANETDLKSVMSAIKITVIDPLRLHEFFLCDINTFIREEFMPAIALHETSSIEFELHKAKFDHQGLFMKPKFDVLKDQFAYGFGGKERMGVKLKMPDAAIYFMIVSNRSKTLAKQEVEKLLQQLNEHWQEVVTKFLQEALGAIEGNIRYYKIESLNKKSEINAKNPILEPYFTELNNPQKTKCINNGWIMGHNCMEDFGMIGFHYLRRTVNVWGDCIKLRYGKCPADSPYLWKHMTEYVQSMAQVADGFRLDNTHSTPIHVAQYLLQAARCKNKNLFLMAELFTSSAELDAMFCQKLNLNGLVRELQNRSDTKSLGDYFHWLTCREAVLGMIDLTRKDNKNRPYKVLSSKQPDDIIYDCTHDNPSVIDKFQTGRIALPHIGLNSMSDTAIATTWGYDQLVHKQIHCVHEFRQYPIEDQRSIVSDVLASNVQIGDIDIEELPKTSVEIVEPKPFSHYFKVDFPGANSVALAHSLNGWKPDIQLNKTGDGCWEVHAPFLANAQGQKLLYKFVLNGKDWQCHKSSPQEKDSSGNSNNVLVLPSQQSGSVVQSSNNSIFASRPKPVEPLKQQTYGDIRYARCILNQIHKECTEQNASIYLHQQSADVLVVTRQLDMDKYVDFDSYISITRFCFYNKGGEYAYKTSIELPGFMTEVVFAGYLEIPDSVYNDPGLNNNREGEILRGPKGISLHTFNQIEGKFCTREKLSDKNEVLHFHLMPPSFTCILKVKSRSYVKEAVMHLNQISSDKRTGKLFEQTKMSGFNHLLFRCDTEERDISAGKRGSYGLRNTGNFAYSGIASFVFHLKSIKKNKDMGAELFDNIRQGDWLLDYTLDRIRTYQAEESDIGLQRCVEWLAEYSNEIKKLPNYLKPKYASIVIETLYSAAVQDIINTKILDEYLADTTDPFLTSLAVSIFQFIARIPSVFFKGHKDTMCAGLTHFSTGYMRCWGRDTFISLRGLLISPGFDQEARDIILFFAKVYRHGLLPNLHDGGNNTRFNSRDAPWFFLQAIKDYCLMSFEQNKFLDQQLELHFRDDDQSAHLRKTKGRTLSILELIIEIVTRHCQGIEFREWNAGMQIDGQMKSNGFNVSIQCDLDNTGFCFGGNVDNCGTWMDKMGSSEVTGNKGVPATPRDGAPIELVAMQYSVLTWLAQLNDQGVIQQSGVVIRKQNAEINVNFKSWANQMRQNFERCFWVPSSSSEDSAYVIDPKHVARRGIYKDVFGSTQKYADYQLRPNVCIAMSYAPELFDKGHAKTCLITVSQILMERGCMGIKTLDPNDKNYNGDYVNSDASHGWNYHNGPEWLWPVGFFLKAQLLFMDYQSVDEARKETMKWLRPHRIHIEEDQWMGLPELTNSNGKHCSDSCATQAWSVATINDALRDLYYFGTRPQI